VGEQGGANESFCVPMVAQGEALGVLHLGARRVAAGPEMPDDPEDPLSPTTQWLAIAVAQNVALSLANLRLRETLHRQSVRDPLTGLYNRRYLEETMVREEARAKRTRSTLGVILLDIDHFKQFNDTYGHGAGDQVLQAVGRLLKGRVRAEDVVCRYGGEEFIVVMPGASLETVESRAQTLRREAAHLGLEGLNPAQTPITLSAGIAVFPDHGEGWEAVIAAADAALYQAKHEGRDRIVAADIDPERT
jgi:diguanylate cyclase (GGDEF)-like protein